jgi:hypothetical protein
MQNSSQCLMFALFLCLTPDLISAQSGSTQDFGGTSFSNFGGITGTSQQFGNMEFYNFSNGQSTTRQSFGNMDFYSSSSPGLSGTVQSFGNQAYGNWNDGTTSTHQTSGNMRFDTYHRNNQTTTCTAQRFENQTFSNCR